MKNRFIAALMLACLAMWSVPGAVAASSSSTAQKSGQPVSERNHSCCPSVHSRFVPPLFVKPGPASMPCGEQHPCCARQGPENLPSLPATTRLAGRGSDGVLTTIADHRRDDAMLVGIQASVRKLIRS